MLPLRSLVFTLLVPGFIAVYVPRQITGFHFQHRGPWQAGWLLIILGSAIYFCCLLSFLSANGTPAIFFTRPLRAIIGSEPSVLVRSGLYKFSRNPMYLSVVTVVIGQALLYASRPLAAYGIAMFLLFHLVVVLIEEPHLKARDPKLFEQYCRQVPRWFRLRKKNRVKGIG